MIEAIAGVIAASASASAGIVTSGLLAEWRFDNGSGQVLTDYSGNGRHGQLGTTSGADATDPDWTSEGLSFVSANADRVIVPAFNSPTTGFHLDLAIKASSSSPNSACAFVAHGTGNDALLQILRDTAAATFQVRVNYEGGATHKIMTSTNSLFDTAWHLVQVDLNNLAVTSFVDGVQGINDTIPNAVEVINGAITFGSRGNGTLPLQGEIAWALWYSRSLSAGERAQNRTALTALLAARGVTLP